VIAAHEVGRLVSWSQHEGASGVKVEGHEPGMARLVGTSTLARARVGSTG
jgi:hypothetical protein